MEHWIQETLHILQRSPTGALPLSSIREELNRAGIRLGNRDPRLLAALERRKELFRVIRIPPGPWTLALSLPAVTGPLREPWVTLREPPPREPRFGEDVVHRIREAVQVWGETLDERSPSAVARWIRANLEVAWSLSRQ